MEITDDISKWDLTGLTEAFEGNTKYILGKLLNTQARILQHTVKNKYLAPESFEVQCMLPLASMVMRELADDAKNNILSKIEVINGSAEFQDNPDIMIVPRVHTLQTPLVTEAALADFNSYSALDSEAEYMSIIRDELVSLYKNILEDETVTTLYISTVFMVQYDTDVVGIKPVSYATQYAIYRQR